MFPGKWAGTLGAVAIAVLAVTGCTSGGASGSAAHPAGSRAASTPASAGASATAAASPGTSAPSGSGTSGSGTSAVPGAPGWSMLPIPGSPAGPEKPNYANPDAAGSVSCGSPTFCMAASDDGYTWRWNGTAWSGPTAVDPLTSTSPVAENGLASFEISCTASQFCMLIDEQDAYVYSGGTWSKSANDWSGDNAYLVSCASAEFCMIYGTDGDQWPYVNGHWKPDANQDSTQAYQAASCAPGTTTCYAVDSNNQVLKYSDGTWTMGAVIESPGPSDNSVTVEAISCPTAAFCAAIDDQDDAFTMSGSAWVQESTGISQDNTEAVTCGSPSFCFAVDNGALTRWNGATWAASGTWPFSAEALSTTDEISCLPAGTCVAVAPGAPSPGLLFKRS